MTNDLRERMLANRQVLAEMRSLEASTAAHAEEVAAAAKQLARHSEQINDDLQTTRCLHREANAALESVLESNLAFKRWPFILASAAGTATGALIAALLLL